jgi:prolyl-tRNA synthetase
MAPFELVICPIGMDKSEQVKKIAFELYENCKKNGIDVLLDDRGERPGVMFAESDLIGIPHRIVVGERGLAEGKVEYKSRTSPEAQNLLLSEVIVFYSQKSMLKQGLKFFVSLYLFSLCDNAFFGG